MESEFNLMNALDLRNMGKKILKDQFKFPGSFREANATC